MTNQDNELNTFFYPKNIAVVGVSPKISNMGKNIVLNLLNMGYQGEIFSVGTKEGVAFGQRIYQSVDHIDCKVDIAVILTPARFVPGILEECGRKGIKHAVIQSGGFSEMGEGGRPLEGECLAIAKKYGMRFLGPNCFGVTNLENGVAMPFMPLREDITSGNVSFLAQSGGIGIGYLELLTEEKIGINKFVSMGNKLNVDETDLLDYLINDEGTEIILVYLEGFKNGRKFIEIASKSNKPILVHKSNRFKESARIAHSHTAALFTDDLLVDFALEQAGCIRINSMSDAADYIKILELPPMKGRQLTILSRSGGQAVIAADACTHHGFILPPFPGEFLEKIEKRMRSKVVRLQNPLDLGDLFDLAFYHDVLEETLKREDVDGVLLIHGYRRGFGQTAARELIGKVEQLVSRYNKPVAIVVQTDIVELDYLRKNSKMPIFTSSESAMRALHVSHTWVSRKKAGIATQPLKGINTINAREILEKASAREYLFLHESIELITNYGFSVPAYRLARTPDEAIQAFNTLNGPVAMKVNRPHVSHKTDKGFIKLGLNSQEAVQEAFEEIVSLVKSPDIEVMVQAMVTQGREVILGGKQDKTFGPIILFGLGGVLVEALGDIVWRVAPIHHYDAKAMINQIKGRKILAGMRGEGPYDLEALEDLLVKLSRILTDFPVIQEIDINPVKVAVQGGGGLALDARVILNHCI